MSKNINQVFAANPVSSNLITDLMYFGRGITDTAMAYGDFKKQFALSTLTSAHIYVGNASNVATDVALSGDGTLSNIGALTISKIGGVSISLAGSFTTSGAFAVTQTYTGITNVTFPTTGTLATTSQLPTPSALTKVDDTNVTLTLGGTPATSLLQAVSLTLGWTGTLSETRGGTNQSTYILGDTLYASAANTLSKLAGNITAVKQYLSQTGTGIVSAAPSWETISGTDITGAALTKVDDTNVTLTLGGTPTTALLRAASLTLGWSGQLSLTRGGTNASLTANNGGIVWSNASQLQILSGTATASQLLLSGASGSPSWTTLTFPSTCALGDTIYGSATNVLTMLAGNITTAKQYLSQTGNGAASAAPSWATISGSDITGAALTKTDDTNVTLTLGGTPTTALLRAASLTLGWTGTLSLTRGGTAASLTADNGAIVYSTASALALLAHTTTAGLALLSGNNAAPTWSTSKPITQVILQSFTSTGAFTYTPTTGMVYCIVEAIGAGGAGGGGTGAVGQSAMGSGGGAGGYCRKLITAATIGASQTGSVGTGGTGVSGGSGNTGGNTTFGAILTANGGVGGAQGTSTAGVSIVAGSNGGTATGGDQNTRGGSGGAGITVLGSSSTGTLPGAGGANPVSASIRGVIGNTGNAGLLYGGGGSGAGEFNTATARTGGAGADGAVFVYEFVSV